MHFVYHVSPVGALLLAADAAGLPIFPAVVRYDECERGKVEHAMRFTVRRSRRGYVLPATHWASRSYDKSFPRMGERFRLRRIVYLDVGVNVFIGGGGRMSWGPYIQTSVCLKGCNP